MTGFYEEIGAVTPVGDHNLDYHTDVTINLPQDGQMIMFDETSQQWLNVDKTNLLNLGDLGDVDTVGAIDGQFLKWDGPQGIWVPATETTALALNDLTDVNADTPVDAEVLTWNGGISRWVNSPAGGGSGVANLPDLLDVTLGTLTSGEVLTYDGVDWKNIAPIDSVAELTDTTITAPSNGEALIYEGGVWINKDPATATANPLTVGNGANGTNAALILNAGSNAGDTECVQFQQGGNTIWSICQEVLLGDNLLSISSATEDSACEVKTFDAGVSHIYSFGKDGFFRAIDGALSVTDTGTGGGLSIYMDNATAKIDTLGSGALAINSGPVTVENSLTAVSLVTTVGGVQSADQVIIQGGDPTQDYHAARKAYVDSGLSNKSDIGHTHSSYVTTNTTQTITGTKTFNSVNGITNSGTLNQLASMVSRTITPQSNNSYNLGGSIARYSTIYCVTLNQSSDYRLKDVTGDITDPLAALKTLTPVEFTWKETGESDVGFLAHEVQEIVPSAVSGEKDGEEMQGMDYTRLVPLLWAQNQELLKRIEVLESQIGNV